MLLLPNFQSLQSHASAFYSYAIEPYASKATVDAFVTENVNYIAYFSGFGLAGLGGAAPTASFAMSFGKSALLSMGYQLFSAVAKPAIQPFVEAVTEIHLDRFHTLSDAIAHYMSDQDSVEDAVPKSSIWTGMTEMGTPHLTNDFTQFDAKNYVDEVAQRFEEMTAQSLTASSLLSATATKIKDVLYVATGFDQYCKHYLCSVTLTDMLKSKISEGITLGVSDLLDRLPSHQTEIASGLVDQTVIALNTDSSTSLLNLSTTPVMNHTEICPAPLLFPAIGLEPIVHPDAVI